MLLNQESDKFLDQYLATIPSKRLTDPTLVEEDETKALLKQTRISTCTTDKEEMVVYCAACLTWNHQSQPVGAVSISGAAPRMPEARVEVLETMVHRCAAAISRALGWQNNGKSIDKFQQKETW